MRQQSTMFTTLDAAGSVPQGEDKKIQRIHDTPEVPAYKSNLLRRLFSDGLSREQNDEHGATQKVYIAARICVAHQNL